MNFGNIQVIKKGTTTLCIIFYMIFYIIFKEKVQLDRWSYSPDPGI